MKDVINEELESQVDLYQVIKKIEESSKKLYKKSEPVVAISCRKTPVVTEFMNLDEFKKKDYKEVNPSLKSYTKDVLELFDVIRQSAVGRAIYSKFEPKYGFEIKIVFKEFNEKKEKKYYGFYDPFKKTIFLNKNRELGELAYVLVHEMMHALDVDYINGTEKYLKVRDNFFMNLRKVVNTNNVKDNINKLSKIFHIMEQIADVLVFRTERFAYSASFLVWNELYEKFSNYFNEKPKMHADEDIIKLTGIHKLNIEKFKKGYCKTFDFSMIEAILK